MTKSSDSKDEALRLEYLLKRRSLELDDVRGELKGVREVNSLCAAFIMYLISKASTESDGNYFAELDKKEVNEFVGRYFATVEDGGDTYKVTLSERSARGTECGA